MRGTCELSMWNIWAAVIESYHNNHDLVIGIFCAGNPVCLSIRAGLSFFHQPNIHQGPGQRCLDMVLRLEHIHKSFKVSTLED